MSRLLEFTTEDGAVVVMEATDPTGGNLPVGREDGTLERTARTFEGALDGVRAAAQSALRVFRDGSLRPDSVELEFGVKLTAEAGAIIAKGAAEGQLVVRLGWKAQPEPTTGTAAAPTARTAAAVSGESGPASTTER
ncbi:CU044_2847 family protein [Streptomyces sp. MMG1121]|uniref:CU044_2847 family protein n=1 Tax=Streptomyces sp. MMG1121 TaxID=1415544 RepID=UPI0006B03C60|nr:CU044_2847 family protein [Streptomyces sp. MMG1121]KOV67879.1 hypothetical protein ADK64_08165 [Streptomyces sp. MMG1121]